MEGLVISHQAELAQLCQQHHVTRLALFGSATGTTFDPGTSDLDFLVEFEKLSPADFSDAYFNLLASLEELFSRPVDLVVLSAVRNPYFRAAIEENRIELYAA